MRFLALFQLMSSKDFCLPQNKKNIFVVKSLKKIEKAATTRIGVHPIYKTRT